MGRKQVRTATEKHEFIALQPPAPPRPPSRPAASPRPAGSANIPTSAAAPAAMPQPPTTLGLPAYRHRAAKNAFIPGGRTLLWTVDEERAPTNLPQVIFLGLDSLLLHGVRGLAALRRIFVSTTQGELPTFVLSASWQTSSRSRSILDSELAAEGLPRCSDRTVRSGRVGSTSRERAEEILRWVQAHPALCKGGWIALDELIFEPDGSAAEVALADGHSVFVNPNTGIVPSDVAEAIALLKSAHHKQLANLQTASKRRDRASPLTWLVLLLRWKQRHAPNGSRGACAE